MLRITDPAEREALNKSLERILGSHWTSSDLWEHVLYNLRDEFGIETDLLTMAENAPCLVEMFEVGILHSHGAIETEQRDLISEIVYQLVRIAVRAKDGETAAQHQLRVLHKVSYPGNYELPSTVIERLDNSYHTSPHLARAWALRKLMVSLSYVVVAKDKRKSVINGPVLIEDQVAVFGKSDPDLREKARRHLKKGSTLQSLAISIYMEDLEREGINIDPRQLKADLAKLKRWEDTHKAPFSLPLYDPYHKPPAKFPMWPLYSEGWKKLWRRGDKK